MDQVYYLHEAVRLGSTSAMRLHLSQILIYSVELHQRVQGVLNSPVV